MEYNLFMELQDKKQYFAYYQPKEQPSQGISKKSAGRLQRKKYENIKLLPHIAEEYHFRITNHLLLKKIISPKRDKVIMQSISSIGKKHTSSHSHNSIFNSMHQEKDRKSAKKLRTMHSLKNRSLQHTQAGKSRKGVNSQHKVKRQFVMNIRRNEVQQNAAMTSIVENQFRELNSSPEAVNFVQTKSFKRFKQKQPQQGKQNVEVSLLHGACFVNPPCGYGSGPTVLKISHISFDTNPAIKPGTLIQLQLIQRPAVKKQWRGLSRLREQRTIKTHPLKYSSLPSHQNSSTQIKFRINLAKIGDFIPLRIWRYTGVQDILVGTIDLPLICFENEGQSWDQRQASEGKDIRQCVEWQLKKDNPAMGRKIIHSDLDKHLVKIKMQQTKQTAHISYKLYPCKFKKVVKMIK